MIHILTTIVEEPNPVGQVHQLKEIEITLSSLIKQWDHEVEQVQCDWRKPWTWCRKINLVKLTNFLMFALDKFINVVDSMIDLGPDKKATVLNAISRLYDYTIKEAMPLWLKPFSGKVKK